VIVIDYIASLIVIDDCVRD